MESPRIKKKNPAKCAGSNPTARRAVQDAGGGTYGAIHTTPVGMKEQITFRLFSARHDERWQQRLPGQASSPHLLPSGEGHHGRASVHQTRAVRVDPRQV